jgi:hypothetical protein
MINKHLSLVFIKHWELNYAVATVDRKKDFIVYYDRMYISERDPEFDPIFQKTMIIKHYEQ